MPASTMRMTSSAVSGRTVLSPRTCAIGAIVVISLDQPDLEGVAARGGDRLTGAGHEAEDAGDVALGLGVRGDAPAGTDRRRAGVVSGECERNAAELADQVAHQVRLSIDRLLGIKRIAQPHAARG